MAPLFPVGDAGIFAITLKMPRAFVEGDVVMVEDTAYNLYQGTDPALNDAWKAGEVVTINFDKTSPPVLGFCRRRSTKTFACAGEQYASEHARRRNAEHCLYMDKSIDENFAGMC